MQRINNNQQKQEEAQKDYKQLLQQIYDSQNQYEFDQELYDIAPELKVLDKLINYEQQIDKMIKRKRFDLQEQFAKPVPRMKHIMRIFISNDYENQNNGLDDQQSPPTWSIKIKGILLNNVEEMEPSQKSNKKFTSFFSSIEINLDQSDYPQYQNIVWKRQNNDYDGIEIKRVGNKESRVCIDLNVLYNPPKFKIKDDLAKVIGFSLCTRSTALAAIWEYIKMHNLQDRENKNEIVNDESFRNIFKCDKMNIGTITSRLRDLLDIPDPCTILYQLKLSGDIQQSEQIYDLEYEVDYPYALEIMPFLSQKVVVDDKKDQITHPFMQLNQKIKKLEKKSQEIIEKVNNHKFKRDSYYAYSINPSLYIENLMLQQNIFLQIISQQEKPKGDDNNKLSVLLENENAVLKEIKKMIEEQNHTNNYHQ